MTSLKIVGLVVAGLIAGTSAQAADGGHDHSESSVGGQPAAATSATVPTPAKMHKSKMQKMEGMLESAKMAKSHEKKMAMMEKHMKAMQDHMKDMQKMMHGVEGDENSGCKMHMSMMQDMMKQMSDHQMMMPGASKGDAEAGKEHQHGAE